MADFSHGSLWLATNLACNVVIAGALVVVLLRLRRKVSKFEQRWVCLWPSSLRELTDTPIPANSDPRCSACSGTPSKPGQ